MIGAFSSSNSITAWPIIMSDSLSFSFLYMRDPLAVKALPVRQAKPTRYVKTVAPTVSDYQKISIKCIFKRVLSLQPHA